MEPETYLGLLLVDKKLLKEMLESSPLRCLEVRSHTAVMRLIMKGDECFQSNFLVLIIQQKEVFFLLQAAAGNTVLNVLMSGRIIPVVTPWHRLNSHFYYSPLDSSAQEFSIIFTLMFSLTTTLLQISCLFSPLTEI